MTAKVKSESDVTDHLEELRRRILGVLLFFLAAFVLLFFLSRHLAAFLQAPIQGLGVSLYYFKPYDKFLAYMRLSFWAAILFSAPLAILQAIFFIYPALRKEETRDFLPAAIATPLLFFAGSAFAYSAISPLALRFFLFFSAGDNILPLWGFADYLSFLFTLMVAAGSVFLLPVFLLFLIGTGLVKTRTLSRLRSWIIMAIAIAAAVLTPPDVVSQALLGIPLYLLFEGTLLVGRLMGK